MTLEALPGAFSVCQIASAADVNLDAPYTFLARTDDELSLVCETPNVPPGALRRQDGWRGFRVNGPLDFSLVGILARIAACLAAEGIAIFAVSTYNTDYVLLDQARFADARRALTNAGYHWKETQA